MPSLSFPTFVIFSSFISSNLHGQKLPQYGNESLPHHSEATHYSHRLDYCLFPKESSCNSLSPPPVDIVFFKLFLLGFHSRFLKHLLGRGFHTIMKNASFSSSTDVGSYNPLPSGPTSFLSLVPFFNRRGTPKSTSIRGPTSLLAHRLVSTPLQAQSPRWHVARRLALIPFVAGQIHR